jgi:hypothetical protein
MADVAFPLIDGGEPRYDVATGSKLLSHKHSCYLLTYRIILNWASYTWVSDVNHKHQEVSSREELSTHDACGLGV